MNGVKNDVRAWRSSPGLRVASHGAGGLSEGPLVGYLLRTDARKAGSGRNNFFGRAELGGGVAGPSGGCWARAGARGAAGESSEAIRYLSRESCFARCRAFGVVSRGVTAARTLRRGEGGLRCVYKTPEVRAVRVVLSYQQGDAEAGGPLT